MDIDNSRIFDICYSLFMIGEENVSRLSASLLRQKSVKVTLNQKTLELEAQVIKNNIIIDNCSLIIRKLQRARKMRNHSTHLLCFSDDIIHAQLEVLCIR